MTHKSRIASLTALLAVLATTAGAEEAFQLVPEMDDPPGIVAAPPAERAALAADPEAARGLETLRDQVRASWPSIRAVDLLALSRYQRDATRGHRLGADPGALEGRPLAHDAEAGVWYLEVRGPRLPARYDIVERHLHVYARWRPASGALENLVVTIRTRVYE